MIPLHAQADDAAMTIAKLSHEIEVLHEEVEREHGIEKSLELKAATEATMAAKVEAELREWVAQEQGEKKATSEGLGKLQTVCGKLREEKQAAVQEKQAAVQEVQQLKRLAAQQEESLRQLQSAQAEAVQQAAAAVQSSSEAALLQQQLNTKTSEAHADLHWLVTHSNVT